ncbi:ThuA domain-containing protein [Allorhodopirellula heiligendammensis]|uniref:ThuA-like domain-containing protein n=1 Tax=Allorhodopirellula heiligendammensis TaxID=2714739 RepID=A0A5C6BHP9_9BACT|nr:ThuA domain-containing protein [Allorhodopirellula heiligendammensis]TWU11071.1 hypothetical protein Poly21_49780 [Allorhodopirellula heiligendammensis]
MTTTSMWVRIRTSILSTLFLCICTASIAQGDDTTLVFEPSSPAIGHIVLVSGDEEYRSEESMPMLGKILSQRHGFKCTVIFSLSADGSYIDPNDAEGLRGLAALDDADLMIIGTRFRHPNKDEAEHITKFLNDGKPVIGIRTATHAFTGKGEFGGKIPFGQWGRQILGEQWVSHHGRHKSQGARGVIVDANADHPILNSVEDVFAPSDVYGVIHLTDDDKILLRAAVTESLDPQSKNITGAKNDPMQPFAWLHTYESPSGNHGQAFATTSGASVDFLNEDLRRMIVNAAFFLTGHDVPAKANVEFVDPFHPTFFGFIKDPDFWKNADRQPSDYGLGKTPELPDPPGSPEWP